MKNLLLSGFSALFITFNLNAQVTNGLVAKYSFNNGNADDEVGSADGTVIGAVLAEDRFTNSQHAYTFDGIDDGIDCGSSTELEALIHHFSVSAWFKKDSVVNSFQVITSKWANNPISEHFWLATRDTGVYYAVAGPGNAGTFSGKFIFDDWNHVVLTWDSSGLHQVYINNVITTNHNLSSHVINATTPVSHTIGAQSPSARLFNGAIDDIRIYDRVLNATEVDSLFNEANPNSTSGLYDIGDEITNMTVYPNPSNGIFNVVLHSSTNYNLSVINAIGQTVYTKNAINSNNVELDLSDLPRGIYVLQLETKGQITNKKLQLN